MRQQLGLLIVVDADVLVDKLVSREEVVHFASHIDNVTHVVPPKLIPIRGVEGTAQQEVIEYEGGHVHLTVDDENLISYELTLVFQRHSHLLF